MEKTIIAPKIDYVVERRYIKKLYKDCGTNEDHFFGSRSKCKCMVCDYLRVEFPKTSDNDNKTKSLVIEHILNEHPNFCYSCLCCGMLFCDRNDSKTHKCQPVIKEN